MVNLSLEFVITLVFVLKYQNNDDPQGLGMLHTVEARRPELRACTLSHAHTYMHTLTVLVEKEAVGGVTDSADGPVFLVNEFKREAAQRWHSRIWFMLPVENMYFLLLCVRFKMVCGSVCV